jgi:hypothetical protein
METASEFPPTFLLQCYHSAVGCTLSGDDRSKFWEEINVPGRQDLL